MGTHELSNYLRGNKPVDHVGNYLASLDFVDMINNAKSICKTKEERIALFDAIRPNIRMNNHNQKLSVIYPEFIKVRACI